MFQKCLRLIFREAFEHLTFKTCNASPKYQNLVGVVTLSGDIFASLNLRF